MSSYIAAGTSRPSSDEEKKVRTMRALVESQDLSAKDLSDETIRRFLRARNLDVEKGSSMLVKYLQWRREFVPNGHFNREDVIGIGGLLNTLYLQGYDRIGRPILVVLAGNHKPVSNIDDFKLYAVDKVCSRLPSGQEKFVVIVDMKGYGYANNDARAFTAGLSILQDYYPERLGKMFFVHVPSVFKAAWKIISPFVDKNTKNKIAFLESKKMKAVMGQDIDESQLPELYGGKLKLVSIVNS
ncbi:phosphatidylinositol transfer protein 3-like isoform X2 [Salvia hispanica]|uniref:phosphatidylinositol transfer protein 3-like isoform X2 n=1 Tax=Salvia hispanica TaxID=49212 RepID=UPI00200949A1|nr:phosphatidylinositol transfer protein 3-like isoform X2 [Salvia hispanica]